MTISMVRALIEELLRQRTPREDRQEKLMDEIYKSYILGNHQCFKKLRLSKKTLSAIKKMGSTKTSISITVKKLGLPKF